MHIRFPNLNTRDNVLNALLNYIRGGAAAIPFVLLALVSGCGGSSQIPINPYITMTGVFLDAPVSGINYRTTSGVAGSTDAQGYFRYAFGDIVTFTTGDVTLGSVFPLATPAGNVTVTPVDLGGVSTSFLPTQLIGQVLGTLNSIVVARNVTANQPAADGVFTINQNDAIAMFQPLVAPYLYPPLFIPPPYLNLFFFPLTGPYTPNLQSQLQAAVTAVGGVASVTSATDATLNMNQGVNAANVIGTVWNATSTSSGGPTGTFYFQPDGNMTGFTSSGDILAGTWAGSTATPPANPAVQFSLTSSAGVSYTGTISSGASSATIDTGGSSAFTITQATSNPSILLTNNLYLGGWYGVYNPVGVSGHGTPVYLILSPDGTFSGIMNGDQPNPGIFSGTWTPSNYFGTPVNGVGSGTFGNNLGTVSFNMASRTGLYLQGGNVVGNITFSRSDVFTRMSGLASPAPAMTTSILPVSINWPASPQNFHSNFALGISINSGGTTYAIKSEANPLGNGPLGNGAGSYTMLDNISLTYPSGTASYTLSVNPVVSGSCTITAGASGSLASPPAITINCN